MSSNLISADSHFVEPPMLWTERIGKKFRDKAPRVAKDVNGVPGECFVCEGVVSPPVGGMFAAGVAPSEVREWFKRGFDQAPKSVWDPAYRLKDQDRDGIKAEVSGSLGET